MNRKYRVSILGAVGILLIIAGLTGLYNGPEISQYAFAPAGQDTQKILEQVEKDLDNAFPAVSLHGTRGGVTLDTEKKNQGVSPSTRSTATGTACIPRSSRRGGR